MPDIFAQVRDAIKRAPHRWHRLVGIETKILAQDRGTPCPLGCEGAGEDRLHRTLSFDEDGAVRCRNEDKVYDAFDALVAAGKASTKLEAAKILADHYEVPYPPKIPRTYCNTNDRDTPTIIPYNRETVHPWLKQKNISEEAFRLNGGQLVRYCEKIYIGIPAYAPNSDYTQPVRWILYDPSGRLIQIKRQGKSKNICINVTKNAPKALMGLDGLQRLGTVETVIKVEGATDMLRSWDRIPPEERHRYAVITNANGCSENPSQETLELLRQVSNLLVVGDADKPGQRGAYKWAKALKTQRNQVKLVQLPFDVSDSKGKDLRDYFQDHTFDDFLRLEQISELFEKYFDKAFSPSKNMQENTTASPSDAVVQCRNAVEKAIPAISGHGGKLQTEQVAKHIFDHYDLSEKDGWPIFEAYNERCLPKWPDTDLRQMMEQAIIHKLSPELKKQRPIYKSQEGTYALKDGKFILSPSRTLPIAKVYIETFYMVGKEITLRHYVGDFYRWEGNVYRPIEENVLKASVLRFLTEKAATTDDEFPAKDKIVKDVIAAITGLVHISCDKTPTIWLGDTPPPCDVNDIIFGPTRIHNWRTGKFMAPDPRWFNVSRLAVDVTPGVPNPTRFLRFFEELFGNDNETKDFLCEFFGLLLIANTSFQKILLIIGPKRSGKGTLARLLTTLLGKQNVCNPNTSSFAANFGLQNMIGKSLAIVTDARFSGPDIQKAIETMLNISGEDSIDIDRKYHVPVSVRLGTRIIVLSNETPRLPDASGAIASRFLTVQLKHSFYGQEDILLEKDLETELPGILKLFILGLRRLMKRGHFVQPKSGREILLEMNDLSSPIQNYVRDCCQVEPGQRIGTQCLFNNWRQWCSANGVAPGTSAVFGRGLKAAFPSVKKREGSHEKFYEGITLK